MTGFVASARHPTLFSSSQPLRSVLFHTERGTGQVSSHTRRQAPRQTTGESNSSHGQTKPIQTRYRSGVYAPAQGQNTSLTVGETDVVVRFSGAEGASQAADPHSTPSQLLEPESRHQARHCQPGKSSERAAQRTIEHCHEDPSDSPPSPTAPSPTPRPEC